MTSSNPGIHARTCPLCESMCGILATVDREGRVERVRPNPDDVWSLGHICPKGTVLGELHDDPDRLRRPVIRKGTSWREADWDEAIDHVKMLAAAVRSRHGDNSFATYLGNVGGAKDATLTRYIGMFLGTAGISNVYSSGTVDQQPKNLTAYLMFGHEWAIPIPDVDHCDLLLVMGGNPAASKGSIFSHRDVMGAMRDLRQRGGKVFVIDPVRTGTARAADQWIGVRPGTDAALLLGVANVLFAHCKVRLRHLADHVAGLEDVRKIAERFPPERVADYCGVTPSVIHELADELARADRAAIYGRIGLCTQRFGTLASWMVDVLAVLTGNLDREGGSMWARPVSSLVDMLGSLPPGTPALTGRTRVRGAPIVLGQTPAALLTEEIVTPGDGRICGLVTLGANPVLAVPGSGPLADALASLECMISFDNYLNETTRHAHVVFPSPSMLQSSHYDIWSWAFSLTSGGHYSPPLLPHEESRPEPWRVLAAVAAAIGGDMNPDLDAIDDAWFSRLAASQGVDPEMALAASPKRGPERITDLGIRTGPWGDRFGQSPGGLTLESFRHESNGLIVGRAEPRAHLGFRTPSGKIELAPSYILSDIPRLEAALDAPVPDLMMVSRRTLRSLNSWLHNVPSLVSGKPRCTLQMHPADASRHGLAEGDHAVVASVGGELEAPLEITADIRPGVVCMPHGWGHADPFATTQVARAHAGVNLNIITPADFFDEISGNSAVNGFEVKVSKATRQDTSGS